MALIRVNLSHIWRPAQYTVFARDPQKCGQAPRERNLQTLYCEELEGHIGAHHAWQTDGTAWEWFG